MAAGAIEQRTMLQAPVRGFTLIEVLVVVFIIGIILTFASLSVNTNENRQIETEVERLAALMDLATQEAVLQSQELALALTTKGYEFQVLNGDKWQTLQDEVLRPHQFALPFIIEAEVEGEDVAVPESVEEGEDKDKQPVKVFLLSSGEVTPFNLTFKREESPVAYRVMPGLNGIEYKKLESAS